jgi:5-methylcytosine-specific restriction endonuclease McrA
MKYRTIKELVFDFVNTNGGVVEPENLEKLVLTHFPNSAWKNTHWAWYKNQICKGKYANEFSEEIKEKLSGGSRRNITRRDAIKDYGDEILRQARISITEAANGNADLRFKINRWVYGRLMQDERQTKKPFKQTLWDSGICACQGCGKPFSSLKGVHLHRIDASKNYDDDNCQLLCALCHKS